jgi:hypothetical protein
VGELFGQLRHCAAQQIVELVIVHAQAPLSPIR